jgi:hypothetical protein
VAPVDDRPLFEQAERVDDTPSKHGESTSSFLDRAKGIVWDQYRELINAWVAEYPASDRVAMMNRLRSDDDRKFTAAFWELYLHEMYRRDSWRITVEPALPDVPTRPDFLVSKGDVTYYIEARCTFKVGDRGAAARLQAVYDSLDTIDSGAFHLAVTPFRIGAKAPATKLLRKDLESWLRGLNPDAGGYDLRMDPERSFEWVQDEWHLRFQPLPRKPNVRGVRAKRPLGVFLPSTTEVVDDIGPLREALSDKGSKYGNLDYPLVLAVNIGSGFHDDRDTEQSLYGTVGWRFDLADPRSNPIPVLTQPGYWGWPGHPAHRHVAGLLLAEGLNYLRVAQYSPAFWPHPHATDSIELLPIWRVARSAEEGTNYDQPTSRPHAYFDLPADWPVGDRFPPRG